MAILVSNNASSYLAGTLTTIATSLTVSSGTGSLFPTLSGSDIFYVTLTNSSNQYEIVKVTARATDTFTIVRAQDGTSALSFAIGDKVELRLIKAVFDDKASLTGDNTFSGVVNIVANTSSDALRITQTGAGNALVVEDSANPDSSPFVVDTSGNVIVGNSTTNVITGLSTPQFQVQGTTTGAAGLSVHASDTTSSGGWQSAKSRGTLSAPTIVNSGDNLGQIRFAGYDGSGFIRAAEINGQSDGTPGTNDMPGRLVFSTTADGASTPTERMRIDSSGNVGIGTSSPATTLNVVAANTAGTDNIGNVFIRTTDSYAAADVGGKLTLGGYYNATSTYAFGGIAGRKENATLNNVAGYLQLSTTTSGGALTERMRIRSDGGVSIGSTGSGAVSFYIQKPTTGAVTAYGIIANGSVQNDVTSAAYNFLSQTNIASGTAVTSYAHFRATEGTISGSMTNQLGFVAESDLISATANYGFRANNTAAVGAGKTAYGFYSLVNTATGGGTTYGFYAAGTAANVMPNLNGGISASSSLTLQSTTGVGTSDSILFKVGNNGATTAVTIDTSGNVGIGATSPTGKLQLYNSTSDTGLNVTSGSVNILINAQNGTAQGQIGTTSSHPLSVVVSGTERMRVDTAGDVSIGTSVTSPIHYGGTAVGSTLSLRSTSASGTTDAVTVSTASQVERMRIDTSGIVATYQPAQTTKAAAATLTAAELQARIIQYTGAAATLTLPTGTNLESVIASGQAVNTAFDITFINTGAGTLTIGANGNTTVGTLTLATLTSATFRFRKTATNTFTVYRL